MTTKLGLAVAAEELKEAADWHERAGEILSERGDHAKAIAYALLAIDSRLSAVTALLLAELDEATE